MEQKQSFLTRHVGWVIAGVLAIALIAPLAFGVTMFKSEADSKQVAAYQAGTLDALTPICTARAVNDPQYDVRVAALSAERSTSKRNTALDEFGWAALSGQEDASSKAKRDLAAACIKGVLDAHEAVPS